MLSSNKVLIKKIKSYNLLTRFDVSTAFTKVPSVEHIFLTKIAVRIFLGI